MSRPGCAYATVRELGTVELGPMLSAELNFVRHGFTEGVVDARGYGLKTVSKERGTPKARRDRHAQLVAVSQVVERLLERTDVLVARDAECAALAFAWACVDRSQAAVHWVATKSAYRRMGLAKLLIATALPQGARVFTHATRFDAIAWRHGLTYQPLEGRKTA